MGARGRGRVLCMRYLEGDGLIEVDFFIVVLVLSECLLN